MRRFARWRSVPVRNPTGVPRPRTCRRRRDQRRQRRRHRPPQTLIRRRPNRWDRRRSTSKSTCNGGTRIGGLKSSGSNRTPTAVGQRRCSKSIATSSSSERSTSARLRSTFPEFPSAGRNSSSSTSTAAAASCASGTSRPITSPRMSTGSGSSSNRRRRSTSVSVPSDWRSLRAAFARRRLVYSPTLRYTPSR